MASTGDANSQPMANNDRLVSTLQACFADLLREQKEQADRLRQAVEELKPKPAPATDKKTRFWTAYKTLADEHDKELLQRYSTDLDTSLIFAGLFSAVDSAFIIQIQPEFQTIDQDPLLITLVAQSLLFISLGSTLLAALLAVLGKQWLMYYSAAGERGTLETRGLERQRKLDGLRKWKFDTVMQMFPLLLQFALFLFAAALSVYLRKIHHVLAFIVLGLTSIGTVAYISLLVSAAISQDSPFQTPLAPVVAQLIPMSLWYKWKYLVILKLRDLLGHVHSAFSPYIHHSRGLLPCFSEQQTKLSRPEEPTALIDLLVEVSPEVPAVSWVLETSTDPNMVMHAADVIVDLQWPSTMDVSSQSNRLWENFLACFDSFEFYDGHGPSTNMQLTWALHDIRSGMEDRAVQLGCAFHSLACLNQTSSPKPRIEVWFPRAQLDAHSDLQNVLYSFESILPPNLHRGVTDFETPSEHAMDITCDPIHPS
ncbi:hypothetical protein MVEN_01580300 [Mycena venus]|uniref:DUF6535 domain-containing protein n=1 Tax=Mycena venus TaxID=2733690 RepID=A0A8H7CS98_9AGAR|nr:hypothetical protein MVEN_01580300 [Mycena venus]